DFVKPIEKKNGLMLEMQVKNSLKRGEQTYLAALIKIKPHVVQEVQDEVAKVLEEFSYDVGGVQDDVLDQTVVCSWNGEQASK
ncbi:UNVERIFIED_CONTAM: hypothetical protein Sradi_6411800, partial [Sesamum radiatum]